MDRREPFCRLVLGPGAEAEAAAASVSPGPDPVATVAAAWSACSTVLDHRRRSFGWDEEEIGDSLEATMAALPDTERGALAAAAVGLSLTDTEAALGLDPGTAPPTLARAYASLLGLDAPVDAGCAAERERLVVEGRSGRLARRRGHCADCRAFSDGLARQRDVLRAAAVGDADVSVAGPEGRKAAAGAVPAGPSTGAGADRAAVRLRDRRLSAVGARSRLPPGLRAAPAWSSALRGHEPAGRRGRLIVSAAVLALAAGAGFGVASAIESTRDGDEGVVTAQPVGPLPPGVGP